MGRQRAFGLRKQKPRQYLLNQQLIAQAARVAVKNADRVNSDKAAEEDLYGMLAKAVFSINDPYHRAYIKREIMRLNYSAMAINPAHWPEWYVTFTREVIKLQPELKESLLNPDHPDHTGPTDADEGI